MRKLLNLIDRFRCFYWFSLLSYSLFCLLSVFLFFSASNSLCAQSQDVIIIFFDSDDNSITQESIGVIKRNANALKATPEFTITLEGYSDITGRADYNLELSEKRALLVKDYLVELDIDSNKIKVIGKGGTEKYGKGESNDGYKILDQDCLDNVCNLFLAGVNFGNRIINCAAGVFDIFEIGFVS